MKSSLTLDELTAALEKAIENPKLTASSKTTFVSITNILAFCKQLTSLKAIFITEPVKSHYVEDIDSLLEDFEDEFIERTLQRLESFGLNISEKDKANSKTIIIRQQDEPHNDDSMLNQLFLNSYLRGGSLYPPMQGGFMGPPQYQPMYPQYSAPPQPVYPAYPPQYPQAPAPAPAPTYAPAPQPAPAPAPTPAPAPAAPPAPKPAPAPAPAPQQSSSLDEPFDSGNSSSSSSGSSPAGDFNIGGGSDEPAAGRDYLLSLLSK